MYIALSVNTNLNILCLDITFNHFGAKPCEDAQKEALDSYAHTPLGPASALHSLLLPHVLKCLVYIAVPPVHHFTYKHAILRAPLKALV